VFRWLFKLLGVRCYKVVMSRLAEDGSIDRVWIRVWWDPEDKWSSRRQAYDFIASMEEKGFTVESQNL
jgi:hypothetical protein